MDENKNGIINSDLNYIKEAMNDLVSKTNNYASYCGDKHDVKSTIEGNKLYSKINNIMEMYYNSQTKIMNNMRNEAKMIVQTGEAYDALDKELKSKTGDL